MTENRHSHRYHEWGWLLVNNIREKPTLPEMVFLDFYGIRDDDVINKNRLPRNHNSHHHHEWG